MHKYGLCFTIFFLFSSTLSGQLGIKGGLAVSAMQASSEDYAPFLGYEVTWVQRGTSNPVFGLQLGAFYSFHISGEFIFQPELYFAQRGYQFDQTPLYDINYSLHLNYLELPFIIEYYLPLGWGFQPAIIAGGYSSIKLSSKKTISLPYEETDGEVSNVKSIDYGIVFGITTEFSAWDGGLIFDLRINWGLANVLSRPDDFISLYDDPGTVKTRVITFMTGYRFHLYL